MFRQPLFTRCVDGIVRVFVFHRLSSAAGDSCGALASFQRRTQALLNALGPGPYAMNVVATAACDEIERLGMLARAIDLDRCDLLVVESQDRMSRHHRQLQSFLRGVRQAGVRIVALDDGFDTAVESLPATFGLSRVGGSVPPGAAGLNGCS